MPVQVAGSINVDLIQTVTALPRPGETVLATQSARLPGGKGANQAVAAARLGAQTALIGAIGNDEGGRWMAAQLSAAGVDIAGLTTLDGASTGTAYITVDAAGENQIIVASGANAALTAQQVAASSGGRAVRVTQLEIPVETIRAFFTAGQAQGGLSILNAAPALIEAADLFDLVDILVVNQHELAIYLGLPAAPANAQEALVARSLIRRTGQIIIVTLGAQGALAVSAEDEVYVPALPVRPVDTIGAGDCFVGAFAAMLDAEPDRPISEALRFANAAAALCTLQPGAIPAMPTRAQVEALLAGSAP